MPVPPNYFISGVWFTKSTSSKRISSVFLHRNTETGFEKGIKTSEADVIKLLKGKSTIMTLRWDYSAASWKKGAYVGYETLQNVEILRTHKDATVTDNLDNMIDMDALI